MTELLLELFSEEIPAGMQLKAANDFSTKISEKLSENKIKYSDIKSYVTPRRLVVYVKDLPKTLEENITEKRGPRVDAPLKAVEGFAKSVGIKIEDLEKRETKKGSFYFSVVKESGKDVGKLLTDILEEVISSYSWPKSMRWGKFNIKWVRPLHNILCLFGGKILDIKFGHLNSNNKSYGHRFLANKEFEVKSFTDYSKKLKEHYVILDSDERKNIILEQIRDISAKNGIKLKEDGNLLDEVVGLVEYPVALLGNIPERFLSIPKEALISAMRYHQKYFSFYDIHGNLAPYFVTISNVFSDDNQAKIIAGNEKVLSARLEDAKFFFEQDKKESLEKQLQDQEKIIFHAKIGTMAEKTKRVIELAKLFAVWIPHANLILVERAAQLAKTDLTSQMVGEFPELQGLMGYYYALENGEDQQVAAAIKNHYKPVGQKDDCPTEPLSIAVALADKIDTLVGLFIIGEKPTGSKDPFALRRAALGVIRIILENNLRIPLRLLFEKSISKFPKKIFQTEKATKSFISKIALDKTKNKKAKVIEELLEFFADRLRVILKTKEIRSDLIEAVFDSGKEDDLSRLVKRVNALEIFLETPEGRDLLAAYKRATNIVLSERKKDNEEYTGEPEKNLLIDKEEQDLFFSFREIKPIIASKIKNDEFSDSMAELSKLRDSVDAFFENVVVNCDNPNVRKNRLLLLSQFENLLHEVANFQKIEA